MIRRWSPRSSGDWRERRLADRPEAARGVVHLCEDLEGLGRGLDLHAVQEWLRARHAEVEIRAGPCDEPERWAARTTSARPRVVLGVCAATTDQGEFETRLRTHGVDPFAAELVDLGTSCARETDGPRATEKAKLLLGAALARVNAHAGTHPDSLKPVLPHAVPVSRRALLTLPPIRYQGVPRVTAQWCAGADSCKVCATTCPHAALRPTPGGAIEVLAARCTGCGACVSACPRSAMDLPGFSPRQVDAAIHALLDEPSVAVGRRHIVFVCDRSPGASNGSARDAARSRMSWLPVRVPCLGMVAPAWVLQCLRLGADTVGLQSCHRDDCRFGRRDVIDGRVEYERAVLELLGVDPGRVSVDPGDRVPAGDPKWARSPRSAPGAQGGDRHDDEGGDTGVVAASGPSADCEHPPTGGQGTIVASPAPSGLVHGEEAPPPSPARPGARGTLFGAGAAAEALLDLARLHHPRRDLTFVHPESPLGLVDLQDGCTCCGACARRCPTGSLQLDRTREEVALTFDPRCCIGCGECATRCPERVLSARAGTDLRRLAAGRRTVHRSDESRCQACGEPIAPRALLDRVLERLADDRALAVIRRYCPSCRWRG
jgi:ferredoxin/coenzyme F420-reducing hydrogenase delta subunit